MQAIFPSEIRFPSRSEITAALGRLVLTMAGTWLFSNSQGGVSQLLRPLHSCAKHDWCHITRPVFMVGNPLD